MTTKTSERQFLERYRPERFARPSLTVDLVILTVVDKELRVLLVQRAEHPFKGRWALPGGFVRVGESADHQGEDLDEAAARELQEETGLSNIYLEQVRTFGKPGRDPRMRVVSVVYFALVRPSLVPLVRSGGDAARARWYGATDTPPLAFDHADMLAAAIARLRADLDRTGIAFQLVPETFTVQELRTAHEAIRAQALDPGNFRKRFLRMIDDGVIEPARGKRATASKPAHVYRFTVEREVES
ncbi:MAG: NUDIX hydrolase [Labilithrix sp.]|nr:NUDIX hydrolase [Labilithrix sp.]